MLAHVLAGVLCAVAVALASGWALFLPAFLSPDEDSHYDYALTLYTAGRPMRPEENIVGRDTQPVVAYLMRATHARQQRLDTAVGADPGYGSAAYTHAVDAGAPVVDRRAEHAGPIVPVPYISRLYPIGYYALTAAAIGLGDAITHGSALGELLFARFLSVALLVPTIVFSWLLLCELGLGRRKALLLLACTALLPLTAWMGGYVQPDNLVCALVAPILYLALRLRRDPRDTRLLITLGVLLALLIATKRQYFLAVYVPVAAMLAVRTPWRPNLAAFKWPALVTIPALLAYLVTEPFLRAAPGGGGVCHLTGGLTVARQHGFAHVAHYLAHGVTTTIDGSFLPSSGVESFWLAYTAYRNTFLELGSPAISDAVAWILPALSIIVAFLFVVRTIQVAVRLSFVARRRSWRSAARVATSNVLVNAYLCYFAILLGYEIMVGGYIPVQGRYWLPFVSAVWLIAVVLAPRALPHRYGRAFGTLMLALILGFDIVASSFTFSSLHHRFYAPAPSVAPKQEVLADVSSDPGDGIVDLRGMAVDLRDASPVDHVVVRLDGRLDLPVRTVPRPDVLCDMEGTLLQTGFESTVRSADVRPGTHEVAVFVKTPWANGLIDTGARAHFDVR
jgi:hypothetical protein